MPDSLSRCINRGIIFYLVLYYNIRRHLHMCFFSLDKGRRQNNQPYSTELAQNSEPAENHNCYVVGLVSLLFLSCFRYGLYFYCYNHSVNVPLSGCLISLFFIFATEVLYSASSTNHTVTPSNDLPKSKR